MSNPEIIENAETAPEATQRLTRAEVTAMIASANADIQDAVRQVKPALVDDVIERTYAATEGLDLEARNFAIRKAVTNYINLATQGIIASSGINHTDLISPANPYSTAAHSLSAASLRSLRAAWIAADPAIPAEHRPVVAAAFSHEEGSMEALHSEIRLLALTASGVVPVNVFSHRSAITASASTPLSPTPSERAASYEFSRSNLLNIVKAQRSLTAGGFNLYDSKNKLERMISRGDSRDRIVSYLESDPAYKASFASMNFPITSNNPYAQYAREQFKTFHQAVFSLENSPALVDLRANAADAISKYDESGLVAKAITAGASAKYVLEALESNFNFSSDHEGYLAEPTSSEFSSTLDAIMSLDDEPLDHFTLSEVLPAE